MSSSVLSFLVYLFPKAVVEKLILDLLAQAAARTDNTVDDTIVKAVAVALGVALSE